MVSLYKAVNPSLSRGAFATTSCFAKLAYSHASLALSQRCRSRSARAVRPASLAASARLSVCRQPLVKAHASCSQACHARKAAGFGDAGLAVQASVSEHFTPLPVSQRLKPQCVVMHLQSCLVSPKHPLSRRVQVARALSSRHAPEISSSKQEPRLLLQPPNPSFKRTRLRRSA
jgi:hypothetical protein